MRRIRDAEPQSRVGFCCGCRQDDALYKIPGLFRYRCARCYREETGHFHYLTPIGVITKLRQENPQWGSTLQR